MFATLTFQESGSKTGPRDHQADDGNTNSVFANFAKLQAPQFIFDSVQGRNFEAVEIGKRHFQTMLPHIG